MSAIYAEPVGSNSIGQIKHVQGEVIRFGNTQSTTAQFVNVGLELVSGDTLTTRAQSRCSITFIDGSRFALGPNSVLVLKQFNWNPTTQIGESIIDLSQGQVVISSGGIEAMQITTPRSKLTLAGTTVAIQVTK